MHSLQELEELFEINEDFQLVWKIDRKVGKGTVLARAGEIAGGLGKYGYLQVSVNGRTNTVHRIIFQLHHRIEELPARAVIDHINGIKVDNRIENLRLATKSENQCNLWNRPSKGTKLKGAYKRGNNFRSIIRFNHEVIRLGNFKTELDAHLAYCNKAKELHGEFFNPN